MFDMELYFQHFNDFFDTFENAEAFIVNTPDGKSYDAKKTIRYQCHLTSDGIAQVLHNFFHDPEMIRPEISVANPNPQVYDNEYMLPRDAYLFNEGHILEKDAASDSLNNLKVDLKKTMKKFKTIYQAVADRKDIGRVAILFDSYQAAPRDVIFSFVGNTANAEEIMDKLTEGAEEIDDQ